MSTGAKFVSWRRVSTTKQGRSGLGLEAQTNIISFFIERDGGTLIADFAECYTGKDLKGCAQLRKAIALAKAEDATLIIAKTDRFRNCQEALSILDEMEGRIMFCDLPHTDRFTLTLFFALAEREALLVSIRTKQALAVKRAQGAKLGAASDAYQRAMATKSAAARAADYGRRATTRRQRYMESPDVVAFLKVLRRAFPQATQAEDPCEWNWSQINTRQPNRARVCTLMQDFQAIDPQRFVGWDFGAGFQLKLANMIGGIRRSLNIKKAL